MTPRHLSLLALLLLACNPVYGRGRLVAGEGYVADEVPLKVTAAGLDELSQRWTVDSHRPDGLPRVGRQFMEIRRTDWNDDGRSSPYRGFEYHLRFAQRVGSGEMWLQSVILEPAVQSRELRNLGDAFLADLSHGEPARSVWSNGMPQAQPAQPSTQITVLDRLDGQLDGQEAHLIFFQATRNQATARVAILFTRATYHHVQKGALGKRRGWPVLLVAGYGNGPAEFGAGLPDFDLLIRSIAMGSNAAEVGLGGDGR